MVEGGGRGGAMLVSSALPALRTRVLTTAGPQQCLQSHLHEGLEVIASLPSAVLLGGGRTSQFGGGA